MSTVDEDHGGPPVSNAAEASANDQGPVNASSLEKTDEPNAAPQVNGSDQHANGGQQADSDPKADGPHHAGSDLKEKFSEKKEKVKSKAKPPGGFDSTPLPDFPPGFTVKFTFHKATNLPYADIQNASADPYLIATLTAAIPKRHKEDPVLTKRTRTLRKTTEAEWEEEWVVANVPSSGFRIKCRLYDEDYPDHDDRLGNFTYEVQHVDEQWKGPQRQTFEVKKRMGSKRAYFFKATASGFSKNISLTPHIVISIEVLGRSDPPGAHMYTVAPTTWVKHYSPMIGRLTGIKVNKDEKKDEGTSEHPEGKHNKKYDFQANELQLQGPVPPKLYHRYVEFRPMIGRMFSSHGLRGRILNKALHKQHARIYNYDSSTEWGTFKPCSEDATQQFLKMAHFDEGGRMFTYVLTLDGLMRFTETGKEFGIDLLSKHTMHSDVATYIACSGEFLVRRLKKPTGEDDPEPNQPTHPDEAVKGGPPFKAPPRNPAYYQLIIDNDSGTYRPDKSVLPLLKEFLERNFPGLGVVVMHCEDEELGKLKENQRKVKKEEGQAVQMVLNRSPSSSSFSSDDESRLNALDLNGDGPVKSKKERAWEMLEDPNRLRDLKDELRGGSKSGAGGGGESSAQGAGTA